SRRRHTRSKRDWSSDVCSSDLLVAHDIALLEGRQADEGRDPVDLAALPLTEQFRRGRHRAAEGPREIPREPLGQRVRADVEVEAAMDLFDAGDEGLRVLRPIDAGGDERPRGPHLARRELAVLPADLEDSLVIPSALLLARVAVRGLD